MVNEMTLELSPERQARLEAVLANKDRPNGITDDQIRRVFAAAGRRKNDPEYIKVWEEGVAEFRRRDQEEWERDLVEKEGK